MRRGRGEAVRIGRQERRGRVGTNEIFTLRACRHGIERLLDQVAQVKLNLLEILDA